MHFAMRRTWCCLALVATAACSESSPKGPEFVLEEVQRYGTAEFPAGSNAFAPEVHEAGGSMLAGVVGVVQAPDSNVYVLDQQWRKIAVFDADGEFRRIIRGGTGDGPGEFRLPVHMTYDPAGGLVVLDYAQRRISLFDLNGGFSSSFAVDLANPLRVASGDGEVWVLRAISPGSDASSGVVVDREGAELRRLPPLDQQDRAFGSSVQIAGAADGTVLVATARPGTWDHWMQEGVERLGVEFFPNLAPPVVIRDGNNTTIGSAAAITSGIGVDRLGRVLIRYWTAEIQEDPPFPIPETLRHHLAVFTDSGQYLADVALPLEDGIDTKYFYVSPLTGHLFITFYEPYPMVREFRLVER